MSGYQNLKENCEILLGNVRDCNSTAELEEIKDKMNSKCDELQGRFEKTFDRMYNELALMIVPTNPIPPASFAEEKDLIQSDLVKVLQKLAQLSAES